MACSGQRSWATSTTKGPALWRSSRIDGGIGTETFAYGVPSNSDVFSSPRGRSLDLDMLQLMQEERIRQLKYQIKQAEDRERREKVESWLDSLPDVAAASISPICVPAVPSSSWLISSRTHTSPIQGMERNSSSRTATAATSPSGLPAATTTTTSVAITVPPAGVPAAATTASTNCSLECLVNNMHLTAASLATKIAQLTLLVTSVKSVNVAPAATTVNATTMVDVAASNPIGITSSAAVNTTVPVVLVESEDEEDSDKDKHEGELSLLMAPPSKPLIAMKPGLASTVINPMAWLSIGQEKPQLAVSPSLSAVDCLYSMVTFFISPVCINPSTSCRVQKVFDEIINNGMSEQQKRVDADLVLPWDPGVQSPISTSCGRREMNTSEGYLPDLLAATGNSIPAHDMSLVKSLPLSCSTFRTPSTISRTALFPSTLQIYTKGRLKPYTEGGFIFTPEFPWDPGTYKDTIEMLPISLIDLLDVSFSHNDFISMKHQVFPGSPFDEIQLEAMSVIIQLVASISLGPQRYNSWSQNMVAFELLEQVQVFVANPWECNFTAVISQHVQCCSCIFLSRKQPTLQSDPGILQTTHTCSCIKSYPSTNLALIPKRTNSPTEVLKLILRVVTEQMQATSLVSISVLSDLQSVMMEPKIRFQSHSGALGVRFQSSMIGSVNQTKHYAKLLNMTCLKGSNICQDMKGKQNFPCAPADVSFSWKSHMTLLLMMSFDKHVQASMLLVSVTASEEKITTGMCSVVRNCHDLSFNSTADNPWHYLVLNGQHQLMKFLQLLKHDRMCWFSMLWIISFMPP